MKYLAFILAIYIFALNLAPCADNDSSGNTTHIEISEGFNDDHQHEKSDFCSPFCICQCCHINATYFEILDFNIGSNNISTVVFYHIEGIVKDFSSNILQPPQV